MAVELPYLGSYKNVAALFEKIKTAKVPDPALTTRYLAETFGFKSTSDRALITFLKTLGFLESSGKPTKEYSLLKNDKTAGDVIAAAVRAAYAPLFAADEKANELQGEALKGLVAQVAGTEDGTTQKIAGTFRAICALGDFRAKESLDIETEDQGNGGSDEESDSKSEKSRKGGLRPDFHYNIQVHLPTNGTEETYMHIFNAIRNVFK